MCGELFVEKCIGNKHGTVMISIMVSGCWWSFGDGMETGVMEGGRIVACQEMAGTLIYPALFMLSCGADVLF